MKFLNIAFYQFAKLDALPELRETLRRACADIQNRGELKGTLLISLEGVNGCISGAEACVRELHETLKKVPGLGNLEVKESWSEEVAFPRMLVKIKKEIIPLGLPEIDPLKSTGKRLMPKDFKQWLDEKRDVYVLDTRNDYEIEYGTFEKAQHLDLQNFRQFPERLQALPQELKDKPVVMFCTGGIRCEKATAFAQMAGFKDVYQLEGGILKYFEDCGGAHYQGNCFVFDRRIALDPQLKQASEE